MLAETLINAAVRLADALGLSEVRGESGELWSVVGRQYFLKPIILLIDGLLHMLQLLFMLLLRLSESLE